MVTNARLSCLALLLCWARSTVAQATISTVIQQGARRIVLLRAGATAPEPPTAGAALDPGDLIVTADTTALLELTCSGGSTVYRLKGPFRVMIDVPSDSTCSVNLMAGHGDVIADTPSSTTVGGVTLGSRGTQYAVDVSREDSVVVREVSVFEGVVFSRATGSEITQGAKQRWAGGSQAQSALAPADIERSAAVYARFDVAAARAAAPDLDSATTYLQIKQLQYDVLAHPSDTTRRVELAKRQLQYKINNQAAYNLKRANVRDDAAMIRHQIDPATIKADPVLRTRVYRRQPLTTPSAAVEGPTATAEGRVGASVYARPRVVPTTDSDLQLIAAGKVEDAIANLNARLAANTATSRDEYALAKAYAGRDRNAEVTHAKRALDRDRQDSKLSDAERRELHAVVDRGP